MRLRLAQAVRVYVLALICTVLSQFYTRTTDVPTQPCAPGATCAAPLREAGWPLPWVRTALHPADEPLNLVSSSLNPQLALALDLAFYGVLIVLIGQGRRWVGRWRKRGHPPEDAMPS